MDCLHKKFVERMNRIQEIIEETVEIGKRMVDETATKKDFKRLNELDKEMSKLEKETDELIKGEKKCL